MKKIEQLELDAYRSEIVTDMRRLVEKYRRIFDWAIPEIDQQAAQPWTLIETPLADCLPVRNYAMGIGK